MSYSFCIVSVHPICEKMQAIIGGRRCKTDQGHRGHEIIWFIYDREGASRNMIVLKHGKISKAVVRKKKIFSPLENKKIFHGVIWLTH